ncbi:paraquat-inducible protein A [Pantoea sp. Bo_2]|uniref:Paraquat-inducible protein A n=1 Tax=Candidatus Pantoea gossypiicola TaxID=2608008 RepID=A0AB34CET7_9GAMM|nr:MULTISPECIES: membrane integrity lipid transport subunit YebS [Pantoea]KAA5923987.1 paraquat-inducible protein A [Pantoea sp. VH_8]KAA5930490.1 paraquat-inducible protein A [Pantoea sp. VH_4]KAA5940484.1 paraquat-inducible protein A [Pantoea sp. VH_3]KAA5949630.1 paraquat-inducible protein A [Pantoea sp. VH_25]KAA5955358.1 paraquat-inducible protein A [Pantoea sp. VH_24]
MKIHAISQTLPHARYQRCPQCDTLFSLPDVKSHQSAHCPRCNAEILSGRDWSMTRLMAMAATMIVLMPFAFSLPLVDIRLLGMRINASVLEGVIQMTQQGDVLTASMVAFCTIGAPVTLVAGICYLGIGNRLGMNLRPVLLMLEKLKEWVMLDIYLIGIAVASIKVQDYASLEIGYGLGAYIALTVLSVLTLIHLNMEQLWEHFYPQSPGNMARDDMQVCLNCHNTSIPDERGRCPRCHTPLDFRRRHSLQKSWAALIASIVLLIPANLMPISVVYLNGSRREDTIFSGILGLGEGNIPVAAIVFIASILVPFTKVLVMLTLLLSIHFRCEQGLRTRIRLLRFVTWVGRWSMLDLFVISLTMSLVNRDQLLAFTMGPAALFFGAAVILTIMSVEWLDSRLLWDAHATGNADYTD